MPKRLQPSLSGLEALGVIPTNDDLFNRHRIIEPGDPFAPHYLRDAAARLGKVAKVVQWADGNAAILPGSYKHDDVVRAYWEAIGRFVRSYTESRTPKRGPKPGTRKKRRKKRRYTKRKGVTPANTAPSMASEQTVNPEEAK